MARGGRRAGRPGAKYPNRSDLAIAPRTAPTVRPTGQAYGAATDAQSLQQTVTAAQRATAGPPVNPEAPPRTQLPPVDLDGPSQFPAQPVTAGLAVGPGAGPEVLGLSNGLIDVVRQAWQEYRDPAVLDLLMTLEESA